MHTTELHVVILAAGQGTRMKSKIPKVLHAIGGRPLIDHVLLTATSLSPVSITLVVGAGAKAVRKHLEGWKPSLRFVHQEPQLGTGHALAQVEPLFRDVSGILVLLSGDVPLLSGDTLGRLIDTHCGSRAAATVLTAVVDRPNGYGRIVRTRGKIARIVEERDATPPERRIKEINSGIYAFDLPPLFPALHEIASANAQGEYYLTDVVSAYRTRGLTVEALAVDDPEEVRGINTRVELADAGKLLRGRKNAELMAAGVTLVDPDATYVAPGVEVGPDTVLHPGVVLEGRTRIGPGSEVQSHVRIVDSTIGERVSINSFCLIVGATVADGASIGPFAHLRPETVVGERARIGNFVELKKTTIGPGSKANHLSYLGDATIGADVNVGAGTITCNYDGTHKHPTVIEDGAFIGSDTQLIAPVRIGKGAYVGAGSSITEDVPPGALGIARGRQSNIDGWAKRKRS
jgi:bifunctional UDP-N-acetylglucosamine pyrophosphorylase/glucosamine-1-phosphate N-acetyltransferase